MRNDQSGLGPGGVARDLGCVRGAERLSELGKGAVRDCCSEGGQVWGKDPECLP